jgi:UDP-N-acetyl-D-galactosamine dehydrogenase
MGIHVANRVLRELARGGWHRRPVVTILGFTFKENVPDVRNTRVAEIVRELEDVGITVQVHDPLADGEAVRAEYGLQLQALDTLAPADAVIVAVSHRAFVDQGWSLVQRLLKPEGGFVADVQGMLDRAQTPYSVSLWRL